MIMKEITTKINKGVVLKELHGGIRFGTDALLLSDFAQTGAKKGRVLDIGTGSGVIPLLLLALGLKAVFAGVEIQKEFFEVASENSSANGFSERFSVINADISDYKNLFSKGFFDCVVTNPPYMQKSVGKPNDSYALSVARREECGGIRLFCEASSYLLGTGGRFFAVYRPDRLVELLSAMRDNKIEPKKIRFVRPSAKEKISLLLIEGKKDAHEGLVYLPDLCQYTDETHKEESEELKAIYSRFDGGNG